MATHREKATYTNWNQALGVALRASKKTGAALRIYHCNECHGFHLTSERRDTTTSPREKTE
jgi:hypothetical protein